MKKTLLLFAFALCAHFAFSQFNGGDDEQTFKFGVGTALSLPAGDLKDASGYGIGVEATGVYNFSENFAAFTQLGLHAFSIKDDGYYGSSSGLLHVPLLVGPRLKLGGFFIGAGVGYGIWSFEGSSSNGFMYSPQVGYDLGNYHFLLNYSSVSADGSSLAYFGLKAFRTF